jgi:hypothetical protein
MVVGPDEESCPIGKNYAIASYFCLREGVVLPMPSSFAANLV